MIGVLLLGVAIGIALTALVPAVYRFAKRNIKK